MTGFLSKRVRKLITPFLFAIILFQLIYTQNLDIIYCFSTGNVDSILPFSWYVFCAILFYFIFYYVFKYIKSEIKGILWIFIITCSLSVMLAFVIDYPPHWWKSLFFFPMGAFVKNAEKILIGKKVLSVFYIMLAIILTIALLIILNNYEVKHTIYIAVRLCPLIYILALMIINISFNLLKWLGNISYEIYLVQGIVFYSLQRFIHEDLYFIILSLISIIVLAFIMKYILNKWDILIYKIFKLSPK